MTIEEAKDIVRSLEGKSAMMVDEEFLLTEAYGFLIEKTHDTRWMVGSPL